MAAAQDVSRHYTHGALVDAIRAGLSALGKSTVSVSVDDLAAVDEFHIGGRIATEEFLGRLGLGPSAHVLDVGCGLGGAARFAASLYGWRVTGIDLTSEFVEAGRTLCAWTGLGDRVALECGSALAMPFPDRSFDGAYMLHVGMNIADKSGLCAEVARVLRAGTVFGVYDVMRTGTGELDYPVPWAATPATSFVGTIDVYKEALCEAGFTITAERERRGFALAFFEQLRAKAAAGGPPPLGLHVLMGKNTPEKVNNMVANIAAGRIAPVEMTARKL